MKGIQKSREGGGRIDLHLHTTNSDGDNTPDVSFLYLIRFRRGMERRQRFM